MGPRGRGTAVASAPTTPSGTSTASHTATAKPLTVEPAGATLTGATQPVMTSSHQQGALANTGHTKVAPPPPSTAISADTTMNGYGNGYGNNYGNGYGNNYGNGYNNGYNNGYGSGGNGYGNNVIGNNGYNLGQLLAGVRSDASSNHKSSADSVKF